MEDIKQKPLIIGFAIILTLYIVSNVMSGVSLLLPSFLLAGIAVGFMISEDMKIGAINGAVLGLISGVIICVIILIIMYAQGFGSYLDSILLSYLLYIVIEVIVGAVGGVLGTLIRSETMQQGELDSPEN